MGYEIAGGLGVKMALPDRDVIVMVGDGSYLMMNSEIATSVMLGLKLTIVLLDNRGFGCINRLQQATGGAPLQQSAGRHRARDAAGDRLRPRTPRASVRRHSRSRRSASWRRALQEARSTSRTTVIVIDTDPVRATGAGGHWWDVAVPEASERGSVLAAHAAYIEARNKQKLG